MPSDYEKQVFAAGNLDPWKGMPGLRHKTVFPASAVRTDRRGNILDMPLLRHKWCFARIEVAVRQIGREKTIKVYGQDKVVPASRCGDCKIKEACRAVATERVNSDPGILAAYRAWSDHCRNVHGGVRVCTDPVEGRLWEALKRAIADRGPFTSSNDAALAALEAPKRQTRRDKWRTDKIKQRQAARDTRRQLHLLPSRQLVGNVIEERNRRAAILEKLAGDRSLPPSISKILPEDASATAAITADVWLADYIMGAMGLERNPGAIARKLIDLGRAGGRSYAVLKERVGRDLRRVRDLETGRTPAWSRFDPDCDLPTAPSEIDAILRQIDELY